MAIIPDWLGVVMLGTTTSNFSSVLSSEASKQLFFLGPRLLKAILDNGLVALIGIVCLPLILLISLLVFLSSPGPIFYQQPRIGRDAKPFWIWKFRSMVIDADQVLAQHLALHPQLQQAW
ncbi:MAG: sugar transferase, partial [Cyanobacteria bacterium P01_D01_bin.1]